MPNRWIRDDVHGITTLICDNEYHPSEERPTFLVEGIIHRSMTLIIGKPEGGSQRWHGQSSQDSRTVIKRSLASPTWLAF